MTPEMLAAERKRLQAEHSNSDSDSGGRELYFRITPELWATMDREYVETGHVSEKVRTRAADLVNSFVHAFGDVRGKSVTVSVWID